MEHSIEKLSQTARTISLSPNVSYIDDVQLSDGLLSGSIKNAAVVACSDMGWLVPYVCSSADVQLHLFQNFGHRVATGGFVENIFRAKIQNVIVYGHSVCEYTRYLADPKRANARDSHLPDGLDRLREEFYSNALESNSEEAWDAVGKFNVLCEISQLIREPLLKPLLSSGKLNIHGWFYKSEGRRLEVLEPTLEKFIVPKAKLQYGSVIKFVPDESIGECLDL